jgi:hypothetical protein
MTTLNFSGYGQRARERLLILGIVITIFAFSLLPTIWTSKSQLVQLKGTLRSANTYVSDVTNTDEYGVNHDSRKAELIFYLNEFKQKYYLTENIGNSYQDDKYEEILKGLNHVDTISVWVKKNEVTDWQPKVFEIDEDNLKLLDFKKVRLNESPLFILFSVLGIGCIAFYFWMNSAAKLRKSIFTFALTNLV